MTKIMLKGKKTSIDVTEFPVISMKETPYKDFYIEVTEL